MSNFNYQEYLKNNPLLKSEVRDQLITESQEVEEGELSSSTLTKANSEVTNIKTMAQAMLDFFNQVKEKETMDFEANANMKVVLDRLKKLAKIEKEAEEVTEEATPKMKVSELKAKIKEDIMSLLQEEDNSSELENELMADLDEEITEAEKDEEEVEDEEVEVEIEDEVEDEIEDEVGGGDADALDPEAGLSQDEQDIQNALKVAYDNAVELGDEKLSKQIGNTITMFTRTRVVGDLN